MYTNNEISHDECPVLQQLYKNKGENLVDFNLLFAETAKTSPKKRKVKQTDLRETINYNLYMCLMHCV